MSSSSSSSSSVPLLASSSVFTPHTSTTAGNNGVGHVLNSSLPLRKIIQNDLKFLLLYYLSACVGFQGTNNTRSLYLLGEALSLELFRNVWCKLRYDLLKVVPSTAGDIKYSVAGLVDRKYYEQLLYDAALLLFFDPPDMPSDFVKSSNNISGFGTSVTYDTNYLLLWKICCVYCLYCLYCCPVPEYEVTYAEGDMSFVREPSPIRIDSELLNMLSQLLTELTQLISTSEFASADDSDLLSAAAGPTLLSSYILNSIRECCTLLKDMFQKHSFLLCLYPGPINPAAVATRVRFSASKLLLAKEATELFRSLVEGPERVLKAPLGPAAATASLHGLCIAYGDLQHAVVYMASARFKNQFDDSNKISDYGNSLRYSIQMPACDAFIAKYDNNSSSSSLSSMVPQGTAEGRDDEADDMNVMGAVPSLKSLTLDLNKRFGHQQHRQHDKHQRKSLLKLQRQFRQDLKTQRRREKIQSKLARRELQWQRFRAGQALRTDRRKQRRRRISNRSSRSIRTLRSRVPTTPGNDTRQPRTRARARTVRNDNSEDTDGYVQLDHYLNLENVNDDHVRENHLHAGENRAPTGSGLLDELTMLLIQGSNQALTGSAHSAVDEDAVNQAVSATYKTGGLKDGRNTTSAAPHEKEDFQLKLVTHRKTAVSSIRRRRTADKERVSSKYSGSAAKPAENKAGGPLPRIQRNTGDAGPVASTHRLKLRTSRISSADGGNENLRPLKRRSSSYDQSPGAGAGNLAGLSRLLLLERETSQILNGSSVQLQGNRGAVSNKSAGRGNRSTTDSFSQITQRKRALADSILNHDGYHDGVQHVPKKANTISKPVSRVNALARRHISQTDHREKQQDAVVNMDVLRAMDAIESFFR
jgi:hypothetical protein